MRIKTTEENIRRALDYINQNRYKGNVRFDRFDRVSKNVMNVTLRVKSSKELGHRLGFVLTSRGNRRRLVSACWHVFRDFLSVLYGMDSKTVIRTASIRYDNREDFENNYRRSDKDIGSMMSPLQYSEACDCEEFDKRLIYTIDLRGALGFDRFARYETLEQMED